MSRQYKLYEVVKRFGKYSLGDLIGRPEGVKELAYLEVTSDPEPYVPPDKPRRKASKHALEPVATYQAIPRIMRLDSSSLRYLETVDDHVYALLKVYSRREVW